jgi:hypothetical protein
MKIYVYEVRAKVSDKEGNDCSQEIREVVAPDMTLEQAIAFMKIFAIKEWNYSNLEVRIDHVQKLYLLGIID